jgi:ubiquinone/menaquinone biosynthesis C-methylase UbiE
MAAPFDHIASSYGSIFSRSASSKLQRRHVWNYLEKVFPELYGLEMLELHSGSGEEALMFSDKGLNIIATDLSAEMQKVTQQKVEKYSWTNSISPQYLDLDNLDELLVNKKYDLIFSNFGGLNSINPETLKRLFQKIPLLLKPGGRFVSIIMPKFCLWESLYYVFQLRFKRAFRRWTDEEVVSNLHGTISRLWFYNPSQIKDWSKRNFQIIKTLPIGIVLPPTTLDSFFFRRKKLLINLHKLEKKINDISLYSGIADHYIIDLQLK